MKLSGRSVASVIILVILLLVLYNTDHAMGASYLGVVNTNPNTYNTTINVDGDITIIFNSNIKSSSEFSNITLKNLIGLSIPVTCKIDGQALKIIPKNNLDYGSIYFISIPINAVKDESGNTLLEDFKLYFVTAADTIEPDIASIIPANQSRNASVSDTIKIKFTEKIKAGGQIEGISLIYGNNIKVPINIGINDDTLTIKPLQKLQYNTSYYIYLPYGSVVDLSGNPYRYRYPIFFTTKQASEELNVIMSKPSDGAKYIPINNSINILFSEAIVSGNGLSSITVKDKNGTIPINTFISNNILFITPKKSLNLAYNTTYTVTIPQGAVKGISGAAMKSAYTFSFTTETQMQSPKIVDANPQNGVQDAAVDSIIRVTFSENIKQGKNIFNIILRDGKGNTIPVDMSINNNILNIRPKNLLEYNSEYSYTIPSGSIVNNSNIPLEQEYEFKFKTDTEKFHPYIQKSYPEDGAINATVDSGITILFNEEVKKGENFELISLRDTDYNEVPVIRELKGNKIKIVPVNNLNLAYNTKYTLTIPYGAVTDIWGNIFEESRRIEFSTGFERFSPVIKSVNPKDLSSGIKIDEPIEITFSDKMLKGENFDDIVITDENNNIIIASISLINDRIIIKPERKYDYNTKYSLFIPVGSVKDYWGSVQLEDYKLEFKTCLEKIPPVVKSISPVNGGRGTDIQSFFTIKFSENIFPGSGFKKITIKNGNMRNVSYTAEVNNETLIIKPSKPLDESTSYTLRIPRDSIIDKSENQMNEDIIVNFTTKAGELNKNSLTVDRINISSNYSQISVVYNKNITSVANVNRILIRDENGKTVLINTTVKGNILTINPKTKLTAGKVYTLIVPASSVKDSQGKGMVNQYIYSFIVK